MKVVALLGLAVAALSACAARPRMCVAPYDCGDKAACVAGRCQPAEGTPAISSARRLVIAPEDVAYVRRGDSASDGALPAIFTLGREGAESLLFLRFSVPIAPDATIVEAYVLLTRSTAVDADPTPISLHLARIVDVWDGRSTSWALQPRMEELRAPTTTVSPGGRMRIRLDARDIVRRWRGHEKSDYGIAIVAENTSATGMAFALTPSAHHEDSSSAFGGSGPTLAGTSALDARGALSQVGSASAGGAGTAAGGALDPSSVGAIEGDQGLPALELYIK